MSVPQHHKAFRITLGWTLGLLFLGSVVHATESSLACPDWPTCYGTMLPEMSGGVFWEHLHRLVAGGLVLLFGAATWLAWKEDAGRSWIPVGALIGVVLLIVQSVLGGVTVLMRLPDAVSSSHLALAFVFLGLTTVLTVATAPGWGQATVPTASHRRLLRRAAVPVAALVLIQSVLGAFVRHTDAGMACPDVPLCLGRLVPALDHPLVVLHFGHRVVGVVLAVATVALGVFVLRDYTARRIRLLATGAIAAVLAQVTLGFLSVAGSLAVLPVSLHTLVAALLFAITVALAACGWEPESGWGGGGAEDEAGSAELSGVAGRGR